MDDHRIHLLEKEKISKAINTMAMPAIIGFMVMAIYNVVDTMFVAWLGTDATSATQVVLPVTMLVTAFGLMFGIGGGSYLSRLMGMKKIQHARELTIVTLVSGLIAGVFFVIAMSIFIEPILMFFGADEAIMPMSLGYGRYIILGSAFVMGNMAMNNLMRAEGSAKYSMLGMAAGSVLNIILDPIFIFVFDMGIEGAAIATSLSQGVSFAILLRYYLKGKTVMPMSIKHFKPSKDMYIEISKVGIPTFFRQVLFSVSIGYLNQGAMQYGGASLLAASGLVFKTMMIPTYIIFGIGQGYQPVVGYNFGAKNKDRIMEAFRYALIVCGIVATVTGIGAILMGEWLLSVFRPEPEVMAYALQGVKFTAVAVLMMAASNTIGIFYQSIGRGKESLILSVARQGVFFLPAIFIMPMFMGATGILAAQLVADILTLILSTGMILYYHQGGSLEKDLASAVSY